MLNSPGKLLIVDDEAELLEVLSLFLKKSGLSIEMATNGKEALEKIRAGGIDAVLSDINMPEMNGLELLAYVRSMDMETPFVFLTGYADKENMLEALRLGATDFLEKPFEKKQVLEICQKAVDYGRAIRNIEEEVSSLYSQADVSADKRVELRKIKRAILMMRPVAKIYIKTE